MHRPNRTDDSSRQCAAQSKRIPNGIYLLADLQVLGIAERHGLQVGSLDLDDCEVMWPVGSYNRGAILLAIVQRNFHLSGLGDYVIIGKDVPIFIDDEARPLSLLRHQPIEEIKGHSS